MDIYSKIQVNADGTINTNSITIEDLNLLTNIVTNDTSSVITNDTMNLIDSLKIFNETSIYYLKYQRQKR